jgi:hypothetical protein
MICKDLKIRLCPQCNNGLTNMCWIGSYKENLAEMSNNDIKYYFLEEYSYWVHIDDKNIRCSYYMEETIKVFYPNLYPTIEKLKLLM